MTLSELKEMLTEIGDYLYHRYFCLDLSQYNNFSLGATNTLIPRIVVAFVIGAMIASILMYLEKTQTTKLTRALMHAECKDEESAKSPAELNVRMTYSLVRRMRRPSPLSKLVFYRGQKAPVAASFLLQKTAEASADQEATASSISESESSTKEMGTNVISEKQDYASRAEMLRERKAVDFRTVPLYIPKELSYRAEVRYGKKPRLAILIISLIALPILGLAILRFFPSVLLLADGLITFLK